MSQETKLGSNLAGYSIRALTVALAVMIFGFSVRAQDRGIAVGIVINDKLVFAKGYGYRDYEKKLPFTPTTLCQIASNSKLFTAVAAGMLVEEGKLSWDKPVRESVPTIQFFNDQLNDNGSSARTRARAYPN